MHAWHKFSGVLRFLDSTLLIMQRLRLLLGRGLCTPNAAQNHPGQFVATAHACLTEKGKQQGVPLAWLGDVEWRRTASAFRDWWKRISV